ncbi:MAG: hypothetical protein RBU23_01440 [Candidatus Auribacterota bacterium]|nr:hypothetical protein [Candidatus Auribacterota bacterium]
MEDQICNIRVLRDNESKENFYIEYSFNGITSHKRFWLSTDKEMKPFNKEVITNILRKTILEITTHQRFWESFQDLLANVSPRRTKKRKRLPKANQNPHKPQI